MMTKKIKQRESFEELDKIAHDTSDLQPLTPAIRSQWEMAQLTGSKAGPHRRTKGRHVKSRIVPIAMDPAFLEKVDRYAKSTGVSRSQLVAEALELRISK